MYATTHKLVEQLRQLGVCNGDHLMVHALLRAIGPVDGRGDAVIDALDAAVGAEGTLMMVLGADTKWEVATDFNEIEPPPLPRDVEPFDAAMTPAHPEIGQLAELFRVRSNTIVTDNPSGRFGARGKLAGYLTANPPWHDYYGPDSPLERLCNVGGRVLRLGADLNTVTLIHYAEYIVPIATKRRVRRYFAIAGAQHLEMRFVDSLDDEHGIVDWHDRDEFALILSSYLSSGKGRRGLVGNATSELIDAQDFVDFAVAWMKTNYAD